VAKALRQSSAAETQMKLGVDMLVPAGDGSSLSLPLQFPAFVGIPSNRLAGVVCAAPPGVEIQGEHIEVEWYLAKNKRLTRK
jgi:hypothetical protein